MSGLLLKQFCETVFIDSNKSGGCFYVQNCVRTRVVSGLHAFFPFISLLSVTRTCQTVCLTENVVRPFAVAVR